MKTNRVKNKLSLDKIQIAKLEKSIAIVGGNIASQSGTYMSVNETNGLWKEKGYSTITDPIGY